MAKIDIPTPTVKKKKKRVKTELPFTPTPTPTPEPADDQDLQQLQDGPPPAAQPQINEYPFAGMDVIKSAASSFTVTDHGGIFTKPSEFDTKKFAGNYVQDTDVPQKQMMEPLSGTGHTAPGWAVWRNPRTGEPHKVNSSKKVFILMFRPLEIQRKVNQVYGSMSRKRCASEFEGETVAGETNRDAGIHSKASVDSLERKFGSRLGGETFVGANEEDPNFRASFGDTPEEHITTRAQQIN